MPVASPMLQRFVDDELARAPALVEPVRLAALEALLRGGGFAPGEAAPRRDAAAGLQQHGAALAARYAGALRELVQADLAGDLLPAHQPAAGSGGGLTLMDEAQVESDIEISRAAMQIDSAVEWEQRELQTFTSALRGEEHVGSQSNPLRPALLARALWQATEALALAPAARMHALRELAAAFGAPLRIAYASACRRIEAQGITPSQYRTVVMTPGSVVSDALIAAAASAPRPGGGAPATPLRALAAKLPPADTAQRVALASQLFDALLADPALPAPAGAAIAPLRASLIPLALRDAALLDALDHPAWRLIDRVAAACQQADAAGGERMAALAGGCAALVAGLAQPADAAALRRALAQLDAHVAEDLAQAQQRSRGAIHALQRTARRRQVQAQVQTRLEEQFVRNPVGPATQRWLLGVWSQGLAETILQTGPESAATAALTRTVDDLLWSLHPPAHPASRQRLVKMLPGLIGRLRAAMAEAGLAAAEQQAVLAELEASHSATLWPTGAPAAAPAADESPQDIVRRLREEVADDDESDAPRRRDFGDSVLDLSTLDTVPAELLPASAAPGTAPAAEQRAERDRRAQAAVAALAPGRAVRLLLHGHWTAAQLLWRSEDGEMLLFADRAGLTHALTRRALERLHVEALAQLDAPGSAVQRAVDALAARLAAS